MDNTEAKLHYNKGVQYNNEGKYKLAINNFLKALELEPNFIEAQFDLGVTYINEKEYNSAIESFNKVLKLNENEVCAYSNLALAYLRKGDYNASIEHHKKVLLIKPGDLDTYMDLAYAYVKNQQYDEAIDLYNITVKHGSHYLKAKEGLNTALNMKKGHQTCNEVVKTKKEEIEPKEKSNKSRDDYFDLAVNCVKEQNFDLAIENLRKCLKMEPDYTKATMLLDKIFKIKQQLANTPNVQEEKKTSVLSPSDYKVLNDSYNLGISFFNAKHYDLALEKFKECLQIDPNHEDSKEVLRKILEIKGSL